MAFIAFEDFVELVKRHTPVEADRENVAVGQSAGVTPLYDLLVRAGYANLVRYIRYYQVENQTQYFESNVVREGYASKFSLPEAAKIRFIKMLFKGSNTTSQARRVKWDMRQILIDRGEHDGKGGIAPSKPLYSISPHNDFGYIYPALEPAITEMVIIWDGVRKSFKTGDQIRVIEDGEEEAEAVSYYVLNKLNRQVDEVGIADRMWIDYKMKRRELKVETRRMHNEIQEG